jgi:uncharacterized metal-binding protein
MVHMIKGCTECGTQKCAGGEGEYPDFCPTAGMSTEEIAELIALYNDDEENHRVCLSSAEIEDEYYCRLTRVEETVEFARRIGAEKIGIATCIGLIRESRILAKILRSHGFEVLSVCCKAGAIDKKAIGMTKHCADTGDKMCDPILQARILNDEKTDLNIVMGLCVGHDCIFYKYAQGLTTTMVVKDRVTGHNPAAPLYTYESYYKKL